MQPSNNTLIKTIGLITIILVASANFGFSQSKTEQLDKLLNQYFEYNKFNGSVLIAEEGKVIYKKGFGLANMEWDIPNKPDTKHRLASITKQFTGMLIMQLVAEEKLDLHKPITTYLPNYNKTTGDKVTIHHLLTHTSGIPNYTAAPGFIQNESRDPYTPEEFIQKFEDKELDFTPGEKFNYSNSGYFLLGVLIEKITGKTYEEVLHEKICTPLNMNSTGYDNHADILKNRASGYEKNGNAFVNAGYLDMSIPYAAGSMYSTVEDLYLWDQALYTNQLLPQKYMEQYFEPHIPAFGHYEYTYGWAVGKDVIGNSTDSISVITHDGGVHGFNTTISRSPDDQSLIVLLNNTSAAPLGEITKAIRGILYNKSYDLPKRSLAYALFEIIQNDGIDQGIIYFNKNKKDENFDLSESEMNNIGYQLMGDDKVEEAAQVFKLNIEAFPEAFNTYDSYAEAQMNLGNNELAIENYKKSIEMNPGNQNGIDMLKKMGEDTSDLVEEVKVASDILESYIGKYEIVPGFVLTITKEGDQLKAQGTGQPAFDIFPKSNTVFYVKAVTAQITFNEGEDGAIESLTLMQGGKEMTGKRLEK